ncbi:hypothetical protein BV22DRAFT_1102355 [Leucogyrophana mollusca]|uniref:Uncharacterized protein n=1 Tax=Leucogyrophana mollusca TaxID=85980 RepID=A0ACB8BVQ1_9AGAM|nr:hypothetical protein BV22DRAFT_1102355 [Leucogyrophana mollusca]
MKVDVLVSFGYPITRPFAQRWRYAPYILLAFAILTFCALAALNTALVGYDVVSVASSNFNESQQLSWTLSWEDSDQGCQSHLFQLGDTFRTNTSAFTYTIFNVVSKYPNGYSQGSFLYSNNTLSECDVSMIELIVSPGDRSVTAQGSVDCSPLGFQASTSWSFTNHAIVGTIPPSVFAENSLARVIVDAMNGFGNDAYDPIYNGEYIVEPSTQLYKVTALFQPGCSTSPSDCASQSPNISISWYNGISQASLAIVANTTTYASVVVANTTTLQNLAQAFYAAIRLDVGHWTPNNIFTNTTAFAASIGAGESYADETLAAGKPLAYGNLTSTNLTLTPTPPSVISIQYTCNIRRIKTPGSLFMNVASATLSMFLTAWGLLTAIMAAVARDKPGGE